ncbi:Gfo/Idh/MocA family oxidoreductase [Phycicoccus sp. MAQZ13P-2]|uniref:Gfo/Idh/MocA family oxidoreductase n=1 Tax=Phycicoccus TaxID=367298 RepID=UPI001A8C985D|nr:MULTISPECIES: Gfo/Idh/MocA family oxidoreductase [Phycicoccus]MBT9254717.1 Gfo/Idh/MocA family oxidoreductase [Phycicoccus mangrovi]MBT9273078.1 Gfo/Idh/MocA family oxidoreductase [Phycicoccus mangrovi]GIL34218.1 dehydrogenase [Phycicoccus sp. DTK01]
MTAQPLRIGVVGTGRWAVRSHIPGWQRDPRCEVVGLSDVDADSLARAGAEFHVDRTTTDYRELVEDPDIDVIDVVTGDAAHFEVTMAALEAGKHVLCEKPVNHDYREVVRAADLAKSKGLKTKLGFTFRYAPAVMYAAELIRDGWVGTPYMLNAYEQNSQWLDPQTPLRQQSDATDPDFLQVASIEGYGAPVIDIMHWWMGTALESVVGTMRNFVPERVVRDTGAMTRMNIDDGDMFIAEFAGGGLASVQSSFVTVGNFPGIEVRIYGSEGALVVRLVEEEGICQTLKGATKGSVEFKEMEIPERFFPEGGSSLEPWPFLFYSNLVRNFATEILEGGPENQGDFRQGALVQETINAFEASFRRRAWVDFPLTDA